MSYYEVKRIYPWLYSIKERDVYCYLAEGSERALLYDAAYGVGNLSRVIKEITDKPVTVVLGHGHIDHVNGANQFDEVWLHEGDLELYRNHSSPSFRRMVIDGMIKGNMPFPDDFRAEAYINAAMAEPKKLEIGQVFDLGGLRMEAAAMEGHTAGSIGLLDREHRILLNSDAANPHIWMFLEESLPLSKYIEMLERVSALEFDTFFVGHSDSPMPKSDLHKFIGAARRADVSKSEPYSAMTELGGYIYREDGAEVVFNPRKMS
jgi:glyoxylase-like metal-dependent hydrolase (beta-lactamase superfamily II)